MVFTVNNALFILKNKKTFTRIAEFLNESFLDV